MFDSNSGSWQLTAASGGGNICTFTSFIDSTIKDENKVCHEAVEEGSFADYNKVETPLEIKVTLGLTGSSSELQSALDSLRKYNHSTDLVNLVTPSYEYQNLNLRKFDYRLSQRIGYGALYVSLDLVEIRQVKSEYSNVTVAPLQDRGNVQGKAAGGSGSGSGSAGASAGASAKKSAHNSVLSRMSK